MPLSRILVGRRSVWLAGRRFVVRPPTTRTFLLALQIFGKQLGLLWQQADEVDDATLGEVVAFATVAHTEELRFLLATCVDHDVDDFGPADLAILLRVALAQCSPGAAVAAMHRGSEESTGSESDGGALVCALAERFHVDPVAVLDWPLDLFVEAYVYAKRQDKDTKDAAEDVRSGSFGVDAPHVRRAAPVVGGPERFVPREGGAA